MNVYIKTNIIPNTQSDFLKYRYSFPSQTNFDMKGTTNSFTSSVSFKIKNAPQEIIEKSAMVRVFVYIKSNSYNFDQKVSLLVSPNLDEYKRFKPTQKKFYNVLLEEKKVEKAVFTLSKEYPEDDLIIIEISSCIGVFDYEITKEIPTGKELEKVYSKIYDSNGKKIITLTNIEDNQDYYLTVWRVNKKYRFGSIHGPEIFEKTPEFLFFYYSTESINYKHTVTHNRIFFNDLGKGKIEILLPHLQQRDSFGKEVSLESVTYSVAISDQNDDYELMESTCYLSKRFDELTLKRGTKLSYALRDIQIQVKEKEEKILLSGLKRNRKYFINILIRNIDNEEISTYKPIIIILDSKHNYKLIIVIILMILALLFGLMACNYYKKYKINQLKLNYEINDIKGPLPKSVTEMKKFNKGEITKEKKKYTSLNEDDKNLNEE